MNLKSFASISLVAILASCKCTTSDKSKIDSTGYGNGAVESADIMDNHPRGTMNGDSTIMSLDRVFFNFDKSTLTPEGRITLEDQAKWLLNNPAQTILVVGHCDSRGTSEYNIGLGERRANAAKQYLVQLGVDASRISVKSVGKEQPIVLGENEEAWAQNRTAITHKQ